MTIIKKRPLVYIAGPYTHPDPVVNTQRAVQVGEVVEAHRCVVIIPHLSIVWHLIRPAPISVWYNRDIDMLLHCQALVRFEGDSQGADREVEVARANGIRTFTFDSDGMMAFAKWRLAQDPTPGGTP